MEVTLVFKGKTTCATLAEDDGTDAIFELGERWLSVESAGLVLSKILFKGKMLSRGVPLSAPPLNGVAAVKCMIMASSATEVEAVRDARSDPTVRGFASEDALAKHHIDQSLRSEELSKWGVKQDAKHRFCRFEPCTCVCLPARSLAAARKAQYLGEFDDMSSDCACTPLLAGGSHLEQDHPRTHRTPLRHARSSSSWRRTLV